MDTLRRLFVCSVRGNELTCRKCKEEGCPCRQHREQVQSLLLRQLLMGFALNWGGNRMYSNANYISVNHSNNPPSLLEPCVL